MICKRTNGKLLIQSIDGSRACSVDLSPFSFVSGLTLDATASSVAVTAVPRGKRLPNLSQHCKGDLGLSVCDLRSGEWRTIHDGYAHDPAWFPNGQQLAFYSGNAICSIGAGGENLQTHFKLGQFNWGPPSVSVSPDGSAIGFVKWKADDRHLGVYDIQAGEGRVYPASCYSYSWLDDSTIIYSFGSGLKLLDVSTGRTSLFLRDVQALRRAAPLAESLPNLEERLRSEPGPPTQEVDQPACHQGRVYFTAYVADGDNRYLTVASLRTDRTDFVVHFFAKEKRALIRSFQLLNGARTIAINLEFYDARVRLSHTEIRYVGAGAEQIPPGFVPLPTSPSPEFGFHYMSELDRGEPTAIPRFLQPIARLFGR